MLLGISSWFHVVFELLVSGDLAACTALLAAVGGSLVATVRLVEADVTVEEALSYAGVLYDLGQRQSADLLVHEAVAAAFAGHTVDA